MGRPSGKSSSLLCGFVWDYAVGCSAICFARSRRRPRANPRRHKGGNVLISIVSPKRPLAVVAPVPGIRHRNSRTQNNSPALLLADSNFSALTCPPREIEKTLIYFKLDFKIDLVSIKKPIGFLSF